MKIRIVLFICITSFLFKSCKSKCGCEREDELLIKAILDYKSIFTSDDIYKLKMLHSDSLFDVDNRYIDIFRNRFDPSQDSVSSSYHYLKSKGYINSFPFKWEFLNCATHRFENNMCLNDREIFFDVLIKWQPKNFYVQQIKKANSTILSNLKQNCKCETESETLIHAIKEFRSILSRDEIIQLKNLPLDSIYKVDSFSYVKFLNEFNEANERETSFYQYFKKYNFDPGLDWKWDFISVAANRYYNNKCLSIAEIFYDMKYKREVKYRDFDGIIESF